MLLKKMQPTELLLLLVMLATIVITIICDIIFIKSDVYSSGFVTTFGLAITPSICTVGVNRGIAGKKEHKLIRSIQWTYKFSLLLPYIPLAIYVIKTSSFVS